MFFAALLGFMLFGAGIVYFNQEAPPPETSDDYMMSEVNPLMLELMEEDGTTIGFVKVTPLYREMDDF